MHALALLLVTLASAATPAPLESIAVIGDDGDAYACHGWWRIWVVSDPSAAGERHWRVEVDSANGGRLWVTGPTTHTLAVAERDYLVRRVAAGDGVIDMRDWDK